MTFLDIDSNCEDLDPGSPTEVITVTETPSVEYWENRSDNDYEEDIKNAVQRDTCFQRKVISADTKPGNMATNEEEKDPITKVLIESDDDLEEENDMIPWNVATDEEKEDPFLSDFIESDDDLEEENDMIPRNMATDEEKEDPFLSDFIESDDDLGRENAFDSNSVPVLPRPFSAFNSNSVPVLPRPFFAFDSNSVPVLPRPCSALENDRKYFRPFCIVERIRLTMIWGSDFVAVMLMNKEEDAARALRRFVALLARIVLFCKKLLKLALQNQLSLKHPFVKAALLVLWTSGDVEKHPGPPLNDIKTIRELVPRLVKEIQGKKVADWATMPSCWDRNVVPFQDINKMKNSDNEEKYALFYEALSTFMKMFCRVPDWCVEEMTYVETGNAPELHKCQTARKIRELLEQHESSDREDILMRVGYQRQVGSVPGPAVNTSNGHQQRVQRFPCNVPGFLPISKITTPETARQIAKGCMAQSKNAGKCQPGNQQTKTNKRSATTTNVQPAAKQPRTLAARTSSPRATSTIVPPTPASTVISVSTNVQPVAKQPRTSAARTSSPRATSTIVRPTTASTVTSVANSRQSTPTASTVNQPRATTVITSSTSIATNPGPSLQTARNVTGQPSNSISTMSSVSAAPDTKPPNPDGQPSNLITLPSDDLDDLGFSSSVDLDQFINKILKDDKM